MDGVQILRQMQLERVIGELKVLKASYYDGYDPNKETYLCAKTIIEEVISELVDNFG